jgi:hypothetical protein
VISGRIVELDALALGMPATFPMTRLYVQVNCIDFCQAFPREPLANRSLVMQREHRIDQRCTPSRGVAGEGRNSGEEKRCAAKNERIYGGEEVMAALSEVKPDCDRK